MSLLQQRAIYDIHVAVCCSAQQYGAAFCGVFQCVAACCSVLPRLYDMHLNNKQERIACERNAQEVLQHYTATPYEALQHAATHCNTLQHTATHYNALQRTEMH